MRKRMLCGVGLNDADYQVKVRMANGKHKVCPYYRVWKGMMERCYSANYQSAFPTYIGCKVSTEWHSFMAFREWMIGQDWNGKQLDKDLLIQGNKIYSDKTCVFVSSSLNKFTTDSASNRGKYPIGAYWHKTSQRFRSICSNPFTGKQEQLGTFKDFMSAHLAWKKRKHELACQLAGQQHDPRVAKVLRERYINGNIK